MTTIDGRAKELLQAKNFAHVATLKKDGSVRNVVIWVDLDEEGLVLLNSAEGRAWPTALRRDPRVTLTVHNQDDPYEYVEIRGRVIEEDTSQHALDHIDAMAQKYFGSEKYPLKEGERRVLFTVEPDYVRHRPGG